MKIASNLNEKNIEIMSIMMGFSGKYSDFKAQEHAQVFLTNSFSHSAILKCRVTEKMNSRIEILFRFICMLRNQQLFHSIYISLDMWMMLKWGIRII